MNLTALDAAIAAHTEHVGHCEAEISATRIASSITDEFKRGLTHERDHIIGALAVMAEQRALFVDLDAEKAALGHAHDTVYAALLHNHDALYAALSHAHTGVYEPANANIQTHVASAHAPSNAQKNSDITKAEIEAKLTGEISSHTHAGGGGGPTVKSGLVNLAAGGTAVVTFGTAFPLGVTPHVVVCSQFNGSDTSTTLFAHTVTNVGFTMKGAGNAAGNVAWIATSAGNL